MYLHNENKDDKRSSNFSKIQTVKLTAHKIGHFILDDLIGACKSSGAVGGISTFNVVLLLAFAISCDGFHVCW